MKDLERKRVEKALEGFISKRRPPIELRDRLDLGFRFDGRYVEIFEIRPLWYVGGKKVEEAVAKARYLKSRDSWLVYWKRADLKWHKYGPRPEVRTIHAFLRLVDEDEYGCFFG